MFVKRFNIYCIIWGEAALLFWIDNFVHSTSGGREIKSNIVRMFL